MIFDHTSTHSHILKPDSFTFGYLYKYINPLFLVWTAHCMQTTIPSSRDGWLTVAGQQAPSSSGQPITDGRKTLSSSSSPYDERWSRARGYGSRCGAGTCRLLRSMFKTPVLEVNPLITLSFPRLENLTTLFRNRVPSGGAGLEDANRSVKWGSSSPERTHNRFH